MKTNLNKKQTWINKFDMPVLIAGPCSAESEKQILGTVKGMDLSRVNVFRAGIWKPRTKPGTFEGVGEIGLNWMVKVREQTGLMLSTEVASPYHVEKCLEKDIDILWLGARTTVNPFLVQEIAESLRGTDKIVLVKNPINPDLALWVGAFERLAIQNITHLGAIHRGFSTYQKTAYRNKPKWQIPIDLRKELPEIPIICDPSHICGKRDTLFEISQKAFNLKFDGLMIETHHDPDNAWSDAKQQVTPEELKSIIHRLELRSEKVEDSFLQEQLSILRAEIDELDAQMVELFAHRMGIASGIGKLKQENNIAIFQSDRWDKVLAKITKNGKERGLSKEFIEVVYKAVHQESINVQNKIMMQMAKEAQT